MPQSHLLSEPGDWHLGPLHPLSHGTNYLRVESTNEVVQAVQLDFSSSSRADEKLLEVREVPQGLALAGRSGWLTPAAAEIAYTEALEKLLGLNPPARAAALRELLLDVQIVMGLAWRLAALAELCTGTGHKWLLQREHWSQLHERWTGARVHDIYVRLGGVAADLNTESKANLAELCATAWPQFDLRVARGRGALSLSQVSKFEVSALPEAAHDAADRIEYLQQQIATAMQRIESQLSDLPIGPISQLLPKSIRVPVGQSSSTVRSATGGVGVWVFGDGGKAPSRVSYSSNSDRAVALFESAAVGQTPESAKWLLATLPIGPGEVAL